MAEDKKEKFVIRSIRAPEEALDFLKELGEKEFANQGEALQYLTTLWNLEQAKQTTGREKEIEDFQHLVGRVGEMYVQSLALLSDTEERVRQDFAQRMENQEQSIAELRQANVDLKREVQFAKEIIADKDAAIAQANKERNEAVTAKEQTDNDHARLQLAIDNANAANEEIRRQYDDVKAQYTELKGIRQKVAELEAALKQAKLDQQQAVLAERQAILAEQQKRQTAYDDLMEHYHKVVEDKKAADERYAQLQAAKAQAEQDAYEQQRAQQGAYDELQRQYTDSERARQDAEGETRELRRKLEKMQRESVESSGK